MLQLKEIDSSMKIISTGEKMSRPGATQSLGKRASVRTLARYWLKEAARQYQPLSTVSRMTFELSKSSICTSYKIWDIDSTKKNEQIADLSNQQRLTAWQIARTAMKRNNFKENIWISYWMQIEVEWLKQGNGELILQMRSNL